MKRGDPRKRRSWRVTGNKIVQKVWHANWYWDERHSEGIGGKGRTQAKAFIEMLKKSFQWEPSSFLTTFLDRVNLDRENMEEFCWIWDHVICGQIKKTEPRRKDSGNDRNVKWEGASRHLPRLPSCGSTRHIQTPSGGYCHLISLGRQLEGKFNDPYKKQQILQDVEDREKKNVSKGEEDLKTMENQASVLNQNLKKMHIRSWFSVAARCCWGETKV